MIGHVKLHWLRMLLQCLATARTCSNAPTSCLWKGKTLLQQDFSLQISDNATVTKNGPRILLKSLLQRRVRLKFSTQLIDKSLDKLSPWDQMAVHYCCTIRRYEDRPRCHEMTPLLVKLQLSLRQVVS
jgi:hypothetical protein